MPDRYHASTWPLLPPPSPDELLAFLDRDYGTSPSSSESDLCVALQEAGHDPSDTLGVRVRWRHIARQFEARTGNPF